MHRLKILEHSTFLKSCSLKWTTIWTKKIRREKVRSSETIKTHMLKNWLINAFLFQCIFHDWGDDECIKILKNCKQAIPSRDAGGKVIIIDIVIGSNSSDTKLLETQIICDLDIMKVGGAERDEQEWKKIFLEAGFKDYNIMPVLGLRSISELYPWMLNKQVC